MNTVEIKNALLSGAFDNSFNYLYGETEVAKQRYIEAVEGFQKEFPNADGNIRLFSAPGRTEVGGNHTDHQHGCVLAGSVQLDIIAVVCENGEDIIRIKSKGYDVDVVNLSDIAKNDAEKGCSLSLIKGICDGFKNLGCELKGFDAYTISCVPKGSGLSSSAAFEVLVGTVVNALSGNKADSLSIAKIGQYAECDYFGKPCGLLDQMASASGGFTFADFNDPKNPVVESISVDIDSFGYTLCVVDTGGDHANLTDDYAAITRECKDVSLALGVEFLRDADSNKFYAELGKLKEKCSYRALLRAHHFFGENDRVLEQKSAILSGEFEKFLELVNASGQSSYDYLQNLYSPSYPHNQELSLAIALTKKFLGGKGACRVHGGGFAGTIQCYIPSDMFDEYKSMIEAVYGKDSCTKLRIRPVGGYEIV